jgi:hypothetical protein
VRRREIDSENDVFPGRKFYGVHLGEIAQREGRLVPKVFEALCQVIEANYLDEEGIFRLAGSKTLVNQYKAQIDQGTFDIAALKDPHATGDLLKIWLREMPEPLLTHNLYQRIMEVRSTTTPSTCLQP